MQNHPNPNTNKTQQSLLSKYNEQAFNIIFSHQKLTQAQTTKNPTTPRVISYETRLTELTLQNILDNAHLFTNTNTNNNLTYEFKRHHKIPINEQAPYQLQILFNQITNLNVIKEAIIKCGHLPCITNPLQFGSNDLFKYLTNHIQPEYTIEYPLLEQIARHQIIMAEALNPTKHAEQIKLYRTQFKTGFLPQPDIADHLSTIPLPDLIRLIAEFNPSKHAFLENLIAVATFTAGSILTFESLRPAIGTQSTYTILDQIVSKVVNTLKLFTKQSMRKLYLHDFNLVEHKLFSHPKVPTLDHLIRTFESETNEGNHSTKPNNQFKISFSSQTRQQKAMAKHERQKISELKKLIKQDLEKLTTIDEVEQHLNHSGNSRQNEQ